MSTRRVSLTVDDRIAQIEEWQRRLQADTNVSPTDTRYFYDQRGDVLFAAGPNDPQALHVPTSTPSGPGRYLLAFNPGQPLFAEWEWFNGVTSGGSSGGSGGVGPAGPAGPTGATGAAGAAGAPGNPVTVEDEGVALPSRTTMNFVGAGVTATDAGGKTVVTIPGGGGGSTSFATLSKWGR